MRIGRPDAPEHVGQRLDRVEDHIDLALVARQRHGFGDGVGEDQKTLVGQILERDRAIERDSILRLADQKRDGFVLPAQGRANHPILEPRQHVLFFERGQADEDGDAIAIERHYAALPDVKGERRGRNGVGALQSAQIDAIAEHQGAGGEAQRRGGRLRFAHRQPFTAVLWNLRAWSFVPDGRRPMLALQP